MMRSTSSLSKDLLSYDAALALISRANGMSAAETQSVLALLVSATLSPEQGGTLLRSWAGRGETGTELRSCVEFLREHAIQVPSETRCFDLCGTGGSGLSRYNVSTTVAFVCAAAGMPVAKHGNRGSKMKNGSFDLLEALHIPFELSVEQEGQLLKETGLCFVFARTHHPAVGKVVPYRKEAGGRTIFNLAGPLANPVPLKHQLIGAINEETGRIVAEALYQLGTPGALVVWGEPGIDEISVTGATGYLHIKKDGIHAGQLSNPPHPALDYASLPGGLADENAETFLRIVRGEEHGPILDMVVENAGACIDLWNGRAPLLAGPGASLARELIVSGAVQKKFEEHRAAAQGKAAASQATPA